MFFWHWAFTAASLTGCTQKMKYKNNNIFIFFGLKGKKNFKTLEIIKFSYTWFFFTPCGQYIHIDNTCTFSSGYAQLGDFMYQ